MCVREDSKTSWNKWYALKQHFSTTFFIPNARRNTQQTKPLVLCFSLIYLFNRFSCGNPQMPKEMQNSPRLKSKRDRRHLFITWDFFSLLEMIALKERKKLYLLRVHKFLFNVIPSKREMDKRQTGCLPKINRNETLFEHMKALNTYLCECFYVSPPFYCFIVRHVSRKDFKSPSKSFSDLIPFPGRMRSNFKVADIKGKHNAAKHIIFVALCTFNGKAKNLNNKFSHN